jgi:hypothetical protein
MPVSQYRIESVPEKNIRHRQDGFKRKCNQEDPV